MTWLGLCALVGLIALVLVTVIGVAIIVFEQYRAGQWDRRAELFDNWSGRVVSIASVVGGAAFLAAIILLFAAPGAVAW